MASGPYNWDCYATNSGSWRYSGTGIGWQGADVRQGNYGYGSHWGCWFYSTNLTGGRDWLWARGVWGGWVTRAWIYVYRAGSGGGAAAQNLYFWTHGNVWAPGGAPSIWNYIGILGALAWNQAAWIPLPTWVAQGLLDQSVNGIAIGGDGVPYAITNGINVTGWSGCLRVEYYIPDPAPPPGPTYWNPIWNSPERLNQAIMGQVYGLWTSATTQSGQWEITLISGALPTGMTNNNGYLGGTPVLENAAGDWWFTLRLRDPVSGRYTDKAFVINLASPLAITTNASLPSGAVGTPYATTIQSTGGVAPYGWGLAAGGLLPSGLELSPANGLLSGVPQESGTFIFGAVVSDQSNQRNEREFTLIITPGSPTEPRNVWAEPQSQRATLHWAEPAADGGSPVTDYEVRAVPDGTVPDDDSPEAVHAGNVLSFLLTGLTNFTAYRFQVRATNAIGPGPWSAPSPLYTPIPVVPQPPTNASASPGYGAATVSWTPPTDDGGSPILRYRVLGIPTTGTVAEVFVDAPDTTAEVTGLRGVAINFRVYAINEVGSSTASNITSAISPTPPLGIITLQLPPARQHEPYNAAIRTENGIQPFDWEVIEGQLPPGLRLDSDGIIRGTPQ